MNEITSNFERLVLGCMDSYGSNQILILQHFSRSTRLARFCTAMNSVFAEKDKKFTKTLSHFFCIVSNISVKFPRFCKRSLTFRKHRKHFPSKTCMASSQNYEKSRIGVRCEKNKYIIFLDVNLILLILLTDGRRSPMNSPRDPSRDGGLFGAGLFEAPALRARGAIVRAEHARAERADRFAQRGGRPARQRPRPPAPRPRSDSPRPGAVQDYVYFNSKLERIFSNF